MTNQTGVDIVTTNEGKVPSRTLKEYIGLVLRGFCMGASDVVPGVSGGTMAFILGIYEELIDSIKSIDLTVIKLLFSFKIKEVLNSVPWQFLLAVGSGIALAILSLAQGIEWLLENQPILIWSFFFGLVVSSVFVVSKRVKQWSVNAWVAIVIATIAAYNIVGLVPAETPTAPWFIFLSGAIVICAMILPGISGSFILFLLGKYEYILAAVNNRDVVTLGIFMLGAAVGITTFARVLSWLFKKYHDITIAMLMGLMVGSLRKIWPWKIADPIQLDYHGEPILVNILPSAFTTEVFFAVGLAILGFVVVLSLEYFANSKTISNEPANSNA